MGGRQERRLSATCNILTLSDAGHYARATIAAFSPLPLRSAGAASSCSCLIVYASRAGIAAYRAFHARHCVLAGVVKLHACGVLCLAH